MDIGIIGYKGHSKKLFDLMVKNSKVSKVIVFCRDFRVAKDLSINNEIKKVYFTSDLSDLLNLNGIVISSENESHVSYIKTFLKSDTAIFCEKPACVDLDEYNFLNNLSQKDKRKIYFNFNFKKSTLYKEIDEILKENIYGKPFNVSIRVTHGLAYNTEFKNNWRSKKENIFQTIAGNVGIHYINLLEHFFGKSINAQVNLNSISDRKVYDTANIYIDFEKNVSSSILLSYASPYSNNIVIYFTDAIIEFNEDKIYLFNPREKFNKQALFVSPKKRILKKIEKNLTEKSLEESVNFFITELSNKRNFSIKQFNESIQSSLTIIQSVISPKI